MGSGHLKRTLGLAKIFAPNSAVLLENIGSPLNATLGQYDHPSRHPHSTSEEEGVIPQALLAPLGIDTSEYRILEHYDPKEKWDQQRLYSA